MIPAFMLIAVLAITDPEGSDKPEAPLFYYQNAALALELLDHRECKYVFVVDDDFSVDIGLARERYQELKDCPRENDAIRWPARDVINDAITFNRAYRTHLDRLREIDKSAWIDEAIEDCDALYHIYDIARDVRTEFYYGWVRRNALGKLRDAIGVEMYYAGQLPPPVPVHWFRRVDQ